MFRSLMTVLAALVLTLPSCVTATQERTAPPLPRLDFCHGAVTVPDADARAYLCETGEHETALFAISGQHTWAMAPVPPLTRYWPPSGPNNTASLFRVGKTVYVFGPVPGGDEAIPLSIDRDASGVRIVTQSSVPVSPSLFFDFRSGIMIARSAGELLPGLGYSIDPDLVSNRRILAANTHEKNLLLLTQEPRSPQTLHLDVLPLAGASAASLLESRSLPIQLDPLSIWNAVVTKKGDVCLQVDRNLANSALPTATPKSGFAVLCWENGSGAELRQIAASERMLRPVYDREHDLIALLAHEFVLIQRRENILLEWERADYAADFTSSSVYGLLFDPSKRELGWLWKTDKGTEVRSLSIE